MRLGILFYIFLIPFMGFAQTVLEDSLQLKEVVVTASRIDRADQQVNQSVQIISGVNLQKVPSRNLVDALMHQGVWMQKTNLGGGSPFVRGLTGNQVLVLQDGIRLNNSIYRYGPNQYLSLQAAGDKSRIEILKGAGSVLYGSDAMGGVINLLSSRPDLNTVPQLKINVLAQAASDRMEKILNGDVTYSGKNSAYSFAGSRSNFGDIVGGRHTGIQSPSGYDEFHAGAKGRWVRGATSLDASYHLSKQWDVPVYHKVVLEGNTINQSDRLQHEIGYIKHKQSFKQRHIDYVETTLSWQKLLEARRIQKKPTDAIRSETDQVHVLGITSQAVYNVSPWLYGVAGIDSYLDLVKSQATSSLAPNSILRGLYPDDARYLNAGIFNSWHAHKKDWKYSLGWRYNYYQLNSTDPELGKFTLKPSALVWNGSIGKRIGQHHLFFNIDQTFRAPNVDDAGTLGIVDFRYEVPNYDLKPEKGYHFSLGHRWGTPTLKLESGLYYLALKDLITRTRVPDKIINNYPVYIKQNTDRSYIYGAETALDWMPTQRINVFASIQYTFGQSITAHEPIRRIPPLFYQARLSYGIASRCTTYIESINAGQQARLSAGDLADNRIAKTGTPAWNVWNIGLSFKASSWTARLSMDNLWDKDYRIHGSGINEAGRLVRLSLQYALGAQ